MHKTNCMQSIENISPWEVFTNVVAYDLKKGHYLILQFAVGCLPNHINANYVSPLQGRETYCFSLGVRPSVPPSVRLSVTNPVRSIT